MSDRIRMVVSGPVPLPGGGKMLTDVKAIEMLGAVGDEDTVGFDLFHRDGRISLLRLSSEVASDWVEELRETSEKFWTLPPMPGKASDE